MDLLDHFFTLSEAYASLLGVTEGTVSNRVFNGGNRIRDLRAGTTDIGVYRIKAAIRWFDEHWPESGAWPAGVPRPSLPGVDAHSCGEPPGFPPVAPSLRGATETPGKAA